MKKMMKKVFCLFMVMVFSLSTSVMAFATEEEMIPPTPVVSEEGASTRAISGQGSAYADSNGKGEFTVYSQGSSWFGHALVSVVGKSVVVSILLPNGNSAINGGGIIRDPGLNQRVNLLSCPAGTYTVRFQTIDGSSGAYVSVLLQDM